MGLRQPSTDAGRAGLEHLLAAPRRTLLASDFDGTLAPIVDDPAQAMPAPDAVHVLGRLASSLAAVAIVTGRPVADALRLGGFEGAPGLGRLRILGQYGVEQWDASTGEITAPNPHPGVQQARAALPDLLAQRGLAGAHVEDKGHALGVHVRRLPHPEQAMADLREPLSELAADFELLLEPGKLVLELRAPGIDKGTALDALLEAGGIDTALYAGDDLGDLAGFDAVERLRHRGGSGVLICVSDRLDGNEVATRADLVLESPTELIAWWAQVADALDAQPPQLAEAPEQGANA